MLELGADSFWYWDVGAFVFAGDETTVSVSGKQYVTSDRVIDNNDILTIDLSPQIGNIWGDYARTIILENGKVVDDIELIQNQEWKSGLQMEEKLHAELLTFVTKETTFEELYYYMNEFILKNGFVNLDFMGNLGHSIVKQKNDRINSIISRAHRYDLYFDRNSVHYLPFRKFIDSSIDVIYFISENGRKYYESEYPKKGVQLKCIRKVARLGTYNGEYQKTGELNRRIVLVSCSNIISVKRLDLIVDVLEKLKHYEIMWYHFGTGKLEKEIERYCKEKLTKDSYKLCGYVDNKEILKKYKEYNANFFINMSDSEGIPVSIMEAMSFGIPVIARNVGGMSEIVNEENGLLLENDDAEDAASKISSLLTDCREKTGKYETMCKKAYDTWNERYNAEKNYNIFYSQMMKGEKRGD